MQLLLSFIEIHRNELSDEYKKYAPMKKADYETAKRDLKEEFDKKLADLEEDWNTRGKLNPNFHKV